MVSGELFLRISYAPVSDTSAGVLGKLKIFIGEGRDLAAMDSNGLSDPWVEARLSSKTKRTKTHDKTLHPYFNEEFEFRIR